ncbi:MAG: TIGR03862 family flavoprotein [Acidimicrobiales bacterium]|nr:TIGR03862 family flavoprotein [Acidimicrobiales bacterium]MDG1875828.1 TIGR03862 family flavoprotein [Acidimicrobiales bacterium]
MESSSQPHVVVVGAGPAGLMAAEAAATVGARVTLRDQRRSFGRVLLLAGRSGLNLTHDEPLEQLLGRYSDGRELVEPAIRAFPPSAVRTWADELGADTFVGSSGRVFPAAMRATALVRAWLARLTELGVRFESGTPWTGFDDTSERTVLALGGASWPLVGGDGSWVTAFAASDIAVDPLVASNAGVDVEWSAALLERFEGTPLKNVAVSVGGRTVRGEPTITASGLEGGPIYALNPQIRVALAGGQPWLEIDLQPDFTEAGLAQRFADRRRPKDSLATWFRRVGLQPVAVAIIREATGNQPPTNPGDLAALAKAVPLPLQCLASIRRAISSAGGVVAGEVDESGMLHRRPGTWVAGEMLAWDAPTGGYLIQACLSTGRRAGAAAAGLRAG